MSNEKEKSVVKTRTPRPDSNIFQTFIALSTSCLSSGIIGIPLAFANAGLVPSIVMTFFTAFVSFSCSYFSIYVADAIAIYSFGGVCLFLLRNSHINPLSF